MSEKFARLLPFAWLLLIVLSRWPGLLPSNFSAVYALMFCAGALFPRRLGLATPLLVLLGSDVLLNFYYQLSKNWPVWSGTSLMALAFNYLGYVALYFAGRGIRPLGDGARRALGPAGGMARWLILSAGGFAAAALFYLITNTASWFFNPFHNPEYTRNLTGWITALTLGTGKWPQTWEFFRNTFLSSGLFSALFAGAWEMTSAESPADKGISDEDATDAPGELETGEAAA